MKLPTRVMEFIAARLGVPATAVAMFRTANLLSGFDKSTLPTELIPLNTIQLSRGLLNFAVLQSSLEWVLPFWVHRQYDHRSPSFVPRSHLGLSMNVTHRNWTAIGNPECPVEPIVDPCGLLTPFKDGWSVDVWLEEGGECLHPSRFSDIRQQLVGDCPIVLTQYVWHDIEVRIHAFTSGSILREQVTLHNTGRIPRSCRIAFAVRPFNPEGISLIHHLRYEKENRRFTVDNSGTVLFDSDPDEIRCADGEAGDTALGFARASTDHTEHAACTSGLANGHAAFSLSLAPGQSWETAITIPLRPGGRVDIPAPTIGGTRSFWDALLDGGTVLHSPDQRLNAIFRSSLATLLMLVDEHEITPGPSTYHQFWFRDAAYMLAALDRTGHADRVTPILLSWPEWQKRDGYFRSQQGEWDANGQVLWETWHHALYASSTRPLENLVPSLRRAVEWIEVKRTVQRAEGREPNHDLLPPGLSAEHLGLVDTYFWDNFWSVGGMEAFSRMMFLLGKPAEGDRLWTRATEYRRDIESAISAVQSRYGIPVIPAGPYRAPDSGMIGSCCVWYPLQLLPRDDDRMIHTIRMLHEDYSDQGLFFQQFIHSGYNVYLSLHIAHAWLYAGRRDLFWNILQRAIDRASPTGTFPEAIHPATGGGVMGDGHHGWAAAEIVSALCDALAYPLWEQRASAIPAIDLLSGVPDAWFTPGSTWSVRNLRLPGGTLDLQSSATEDTVRIDLRYRLLPGSPSNTWTVRLPFAIRSAESVPPATLAVERCESESLIRLQPMTAVLTVRRE